jgi:hypothetical protein
MRALRNSFLIGLGLGAGLMFFYDPSRGAARRAYVRDKSGRLRRQIGEAARVTSRDLSQRARGVAARWRHFRGDPSPVDDEVVVERIRSELGRCVSHPRAIAVDVEDGCVRLIGTILGHEVPGLMRRVRGVHGVVAVDNQLDVHEQADVPELQGGRTTVDGLRFVPQSSPATRAALGATGLGLWSYGWLRGGVRGLASAILGACCIERAISGWGHARARAEHEPLAPLGASEQQDELSEYPLAP